MAIEREDLRRTEAEVYEVLVRLLELRERITLEAAKAQGQQVAMEVGAERDKVLADYWRMNVQIREYDSRIGALKWFLGKEQKLGW